MTSTDNDEFPPGFVWSDEEQRPVYRRLHLDTLEIRVYGMGEQDQKIEDKIADAFNVALEQMKRDLHPVGLEVEADF
jgi:hypothetical protein